MSGTITVQQAITSHHKSMISLSAMDRLNEFGTALQRKKDARYEKSSYKPSPLFQVGDTVVVLSNYYYFAKITQYWGNYFCNDLEKKVPNYHVKYQDWNKYDSNGRDWPFEYDIFGVSRHMVPVELLYAHFYNQQKMLLPTETPLYGMKTRGLFKLTSQEEAEFISKWDARLAESWPSEVPFVNFKQWLALP